VKFYFNHSKLRKQHFVAKNLIGKRQISKSRGRQGPSPFPTPVVRTFACWRAAQQLFARILPIVAARFYLLGTHSALHMITALAGGNRELAFR